MKRLLPRLILGLLLAVFGGALVSASARAQSIEQALAHFERGEVEEARAAFEALIEAGDAVPATVARAERHLGILYFAEGRDELGLRAFERSLAIEPEQTVPSEVSPEQQTVFRTVQRARVDQPMTFVVQEVEGGFVARLVQAPPDFVTELQARSGEMRWQGDAESVQVALEDAAALDHRVPVTLVARDAHGNVVLRMRRTFERDVPSGELPPAPEVESGDDLLWVLGVVVGLAVVGAAVTVGVVATQQDGFMMPVVEWPEP